MHDELMTAFDDADRDGSGTLDSNELFQVLSESSLMHELTFEELSEAASQLFHELDVDHDEVVSREDFEIAVQRLATKVDPRVWFAAGANLCCGTMMSLIVPALPILQQDLSLSTADIGNIVAALALSGALSNLPSTCFSDYYGRRGLLVVGSLITAGSAAAVVLSTSATGLIAGRLMGGIGVTMFCCGACMFATDVSTPLNRAKTLAPVQAGYATGAALGPVIGGTLISTIGMTETFVGTACTFVTIAAATQLFADETGVVAENTPGILASLRDQFGQWGPLMRDQEIRHMVGSAFLYYVALAGGQLTMLPLILAETPYLLSPAGSSAVFLSSAMVTVAAMPFIATALDRVAKPKIIFLSCTVFGVGLAALPYVPAVATYLGASHMYCAGALVGVWTLGAASLSAAPTAWLPDLVTAGARAPCVALLFTAMDIGFLFGSAGAGTIASLVQKTDVVQMIGVGILSWGALVRISYARRLQGQHGSSRKHVFSPVVIGDW